MTATRRLPIARRAIACLAALLLAPTTARAADDAGTQSVFASGALMLPINVIVSRVRCRGSSSEIAKRVIFE